MIKAGKVKCECHFYSELEGCISDSGCQLQSRHPTDDLVKEILWINKNYGGNPNAKHKIRKLLQSQQPVGNAKELYKQWAKEMLEIHGEMTPHYWAAGESVIYWLQPRQPEKVTITRDEIFEVMARSMTANSGFSKKTGKRMVDDWVELFKSKGIEVVKK